MSADIIPIGEPSGGAWDPKVSVRVQPQRAQIPPDIYTAASVSLRKYRAFDREMLELEFDVFAGEPGVSAVLARVPMFIALPRSGGALSPNCRLAQMLSMLEQVRRDNHRTYKLDVLRGKLWRVQVADTKQDHTGKLEETEIASYSVVRRVLSRA